MKISVKEEQKSYLLPFEVQVAAHVLRKQTISVEDIPYVKFLDIDYQFNLVLKNPKNYHKEIVKFIKELNKYQSDEIKTQEYLHAYFEATTEPLILI